MVYARKITEGNWLYRNEAYDADSISELGTKNHELSVWKISDESDRASVDDVALALAMTKSRIEDFYLICLDLDVLRNKDEWNIRVIPKKGETRFKQLENDHANIMVSSLWQQGYLAKYIHELVQNRDFHYYDAPRLKELVCQAVKSGRISFDGMKDPGEWKRAVKDMEQIGIK